MPSYRVYFATRELYYIDVEAENEDVAQDAVAQRLEDEDDGMLYEESVETGQIDTEVVGVLPID